MGVMMQAFYWDCPREEGREGAWWPHVRDQLPALAAAGISALWLPPAHKAAEVGSMGYDPFDYYDLGELDQKGGVATWFGARADLDALIADAHAAGMTVLADMVFNHNSGGDEEVDPYTGNTGWTKFDPASGRFPRDAECFHPCIWETMDGMTFGDMPDLCHRNPYVYRELLALGRWLIEEVGFDGFRYDFVKGYGPWIVTALQEFRYQREGRLLRPFAVGEDWSGTREIDDWLAQVNAFSDAPASAFDFPLRWVLKDLCDTFGFSLRALAAPDSVARGQPMRAVTFVENHDLRSDDQRIHHDKLLAYAYVLTHEGYPCVFWRDWFAEGLAAPGTPNGIEALVRAHESHAGGGTDVLWADDDLYVMQRAGWGAQPGLVFVLNNRGDRWNGTWVGTRWADTRFVPLAWWSAADPSRPDEQHSAGDGRAQFWAPPRGYAVFAPST